MHMLEGPIARPPRPAACLQACNNTCRNWRTELRGLVGGKAPQHCQVAQPSLLRIAAPMPGAAEDAGRACCMQGSMRPGPLEAACTLLAALAAIQPALAGFIINKYD